MKVESGHRVGGVPASRFQGQATQQPWLHRSLLLLLAAAVVLGGGGWTPGAVALSLLGWLILCSASWLQFRGAGPRWGAVEWSAVAAPLLVLVTNLLPLPPWFVATLPGRAGIQADLALTGLAGTWRPLTLDPSGTFRAVATLVPAVALLVCLRGAPESQILKLCRWLGGLACISVVLGLLQVAGGADSPLRLHGFHNLTGALGLFAYRNHQAAFLLMVIPIASALLLISSALSSSGRAASAGTALLLVVLPLLLLGLALTLSRAGLVLGAVTLILCALMAWTSHPRKGSGRSVLAAAAIMAGGVVISVWLALPALVARFGENPLEDARWDLYAKVAEIATIYQPVGAGLGAFEQVFQAAPQNVVLLGAFMNHAHNEWLQLWLELGWPGALLALMAVATLGRAAWVVWQPERGVGTPAGRVLARAATISLLVATVHACFDYSLRSGTNLVVFMMLVALLLREGFPLAGQGSERRAGHAAGHSP